MCAAFAGVDVPTLLSELLGARHLLQSRSPVLAVCVQYRRRGVHSRLQRAYYAGLTWYQSCMRYCLLQ